MSHKLDGGDSSKMIQELNEIISKQRQEIIKLQSNTVYHRKNLRIQGLFNWNQKIEY